VPFYEIMWKSIVERGRSQMTIRRMFIAYWITKTTDTHSEYVILNCFSTVTMVMLPVLFMGTVVQR